MSIIYHVWKYSWNPKNNWCRISRSVYRWYTDGKIVKMLLFALTQIDSCLCRNPSAQTKLAQEKSGKNGKGIRSYRTGCWRNQWRGLPAVFWWVSGECFTFLLHRCNLIKPLWFVSASWSLLMLSYNPCNDNQTYRESWFVYFLLSLFIRSPTLQMPWSSSSSLRTSSWMGL